MAQGVLFVTHLPYRAGGARTAQNVIKIKLAPVFTGEQLDRASDVFGRVLRQVAALPAHTPRGF